MSEFDKMDLKEFEKIAKIICDTIRTMIKLGVSMSMVNELVGMAQKGYDTAKELLASAGPAESNIISNIVMMFSKLLEDIKNGK